MSNTGDIRYGESPFPYGDMYDRGISLDKVVGVADDPLGLTEGMTYVSITLHKNYAEYAIADVPVELTGAQERTIYIAASLFSGLTTIRLGESFTSTGNAALSGQVAGVVSGGALIGLFSWRRGIATLELFPDDALTVFDTALTAAAIDGTSWAGENAFAAATTGVPLYYFLWDSETLRLDGPVRRVLPEVVGTDALPQYIDAYGVFVPLDELGDPLSPIPAFFTRAGNLLGACNGYISVLQDPISVRSSDSLSVGELALPQGAPSWGAHQLCGATDTPELTFLSKSFDYKTEFVTAYDDAYSSGYFFVGWYNPALAVDDPAQNTSRMLLTTNDDLASVFLLDPLLSFTGGTVLAPNQLYLLLEPAVGATAAVNAELAFSLGTAVGTADGSGSALLASAYAETGGSTIVRCYGVFVDTMWVSVVAGNVLEYNDLASGSADGQVLVWDNILGEWVAEDSPLSDGSNNGQLLMWNATAATPAWVPGPFGTETGQILEWDGTAWVPGDGVDLPGGTANGQLLMWNATAATPAWIAGPFGTETGQVLQWSGTGWTAGAGGAGEGQRSIETDAVTGKLQLVGDEDTLAAGVFYGGHPITGVRGFQVGAAKTLVTGVRYNSTTHTFQVQLCDCVVVSAGDDQDWINIAGGTCAAGAGAVITGTTAHYHS